MPLRPHRLPSEVLSSLAAGGGGAQAVRHLLAAQDSKHRLLVLGVVEWARWVGHPRARAAERAYDLLADIEKEAPGTVAEVLRNPAVGAWAAHTLRALGRSAAGTGPASPPPQASAASGRPADPAHLGAVAAAAAVKAGVECETEVPAPSGWAMLPAVGRIGLPGGPLVELAVTTDGTLLAGGSPVALDPLHRLTTADGALSLLLDDLDPYRWQPGRVIDGRLSGAERDRWEGVLDEAWRMLLEHHWTIAAECRSAITVLTPIKGPAKGMDSASARDRFGTIALSAPPDGLWLASTFAHEVQHGKLGALLDLVDLTVPDERRYYAPWRPDPRPLPGLLQGAYAYLGVAGFWRRQRVFEPELRPHIEFAHWRSAAHKVTGTLLGSGRLTDEGRHFVSMMRATLDPWLAEPVPAEALMTAEAEANAHREQWDRENG